jgi:hypothetical protein
MNNLLLCIFQRHRFKKLRRIFGPKRDEVTGEWRRLHCCGRKHLVVEIWKIFGNDARRTTDIV